MWFSLLKECLCSTPIWAKVKLLWYFPLIHDIFFYREVAGYEMAKYAILGGLFKYILLLFPVFRAKSTRIYLNCAYKLPKMQNLCSIKNLMANNPLIPLILVTSWGDCKYRILIAYFNDKGPICTSKEVIADISMILTYQPSCFNQSHVSKKIKNVESALLINYKVAGHLVKCNNVLAETQNVKPMNLYSFLGKLQETHSCCDFFCTT